MDKSEHKSLNGSATQLALRESLAHMQSRYSVKPYPADFQDQPDSEAGILEYWNIVSRHKFAILSFSFLGVVLGIGTGILMKPVFRANTALEVLNVNEDFMNMRLTQPAVTNGIGSDVSVSEEETQATLLQSDPLIARVYSTLDPHPTPEAPIATSGWRSWLHLHEWREPSEREKLLGYAVKTLKVTNTPRTRILNVSVDCKDPQLAIDFAKILVAEFIKENIDSRFAGTQQTSDWLAGEINDARSKLRNSEEALQQYAGKSGLVFLDTESQGNIATEKLQEIQTQLATATNDRIAKQSTYELARNSPPDSLADVLNDLSLHDVGLRLDDATRNLASLSSVYNSGYSKLIQAQAEVASLRDAFMKKRSDLISRIETDYKNAVRRENLLAAEYASQLREVAGQDAKAVQYNMLKREVDSNRLLYDTMLQQTKQAAIATALHASNVRLIHPAYLDDERGHYRPTPAA